MFLRMIGVMGVALSMACATGANKDAPPAGKPGKVDFVKQIQPILEFNCVGCHRKDRAKKNGGGYQIDERETAFEGGDEGTGVTPGKPAESLVLKKIHAGKMPPRLKVVTASVKPMGAVAEGVKVISYGQGRFDIAPDEAMIFECEVPRARYWQVALLNFWFETLDHVHHQSCLNGHQMRVDADGQRVSRAITVVR